MRCVAVKVPTASHADGLRVGRPHAKSDALGGQANVVGNGANSKASGSRKLYCAGGRNAQTCRRCGDQS